MHEDLVGELRLMSPRLDIDDRHITLCAPIHDRSGA